VARSCEHSNEPSGFIKGGEFLYKPSDCLLLKKASAGWSYSPKIYTINKKK
jgi:hypothetical protein